MTHQEIIDIALNVYRYGSDVYGTSQNNVSDHDYIIVVPNNFAYLDLTQSEYENNQYSFYTEITWNNKLDNNDVDAIETYFLPKQFIVKETIRFDAEIKIEKIRENFSRTASNSFVKCKKKLVVEKDFAPRVGKKSLWHSMRILDFGIQILKYGKILNYSSMNYLYDAIVNNESDDWNDFKTTYQSIYNGLKSEFKLAEKNKN